MSQWVINDGVIRIDGTQSIYIPTADEIFKANTDGCLVIDGHSFASPKTELNIRFSKFGVLVKVFLVYENQDIKLVLYAVKQNNLFAVKTVNGKFLDYIIIDGVWHYLDGYFKTINTILESLAMDVTKGISYNDYMNLTKEFRSSNVEYEDGVTTAVETIKQEETQFTVNGLKAKLFPYQEKGCRWLSFMHEHGCGCILGDEMGLGHLVADGDELLVLHRFHADLMGFVHLLRLQQGQGHAAAADHRFSHAVQHVAADGAAVKAGTQQVSAAVLIPHGAAGQ